MDEILLTDSAIDSLLERAWVEVYGGIERVDRQRTKEVMQTAQLLCPAQVRTVYDYMRTHWLQARQLDYVTAQQNTVQLTIKSEDWQALREAAGGEG